MHFFLELEEASQFLTHLVYCQGGLFARAGCEILQMRFFPVTYIEKLWLISARGHLSLHAIWD